MRGSWVQKKIVKGLMNKAGLANFAVSWRVPERGVTDPFMGREEGFRPVSPL